MTDMIPLVEHLMLLRQADLRFADERDRRYAEVTSEREKALKIKEVADLAALQLAREIQTYKDEKANELRSQIERERGNYATRSDLVGATKELQAQMKPVLDYVAAHQGSSSALSAWAGYIVGFGAVAVAIIALVTR